MVSLVKPRPEDIIIDPAMGSAGFLVEAQAYLRVNHADAIPELIRIASMTVCSFVCQKAIKYQGQKRVAFIRESVLDALIKR